MARQKKEETGELLVSLEQFRNTRDSVILSLTNLQHGLAHVQNGLSQLLSAYMQHTSSILHGENGVMEQLQIPAQIVADANAVIESANATGNAVSAAMTANDGKKKRKRAEKKEKDPNAPKRPLTAAFLYAMQARPIIKQDFERALPPGKTLERNAVNLEVTKRWNEMPEEEKEKWRVSYRESRQKYVEEMSAYMAEKGTAATVDLHDEEEEDDEAEAGALDSEVDASSDSEEEPTVAATPAKAPTPPVANNKTPRANKRQKIAATPAPNGSNPPIAIAPATYHQTPVPIPLPASSRPAPPALPAQTAILPPVSNVEAPSTVTKPKDKKKKAVPQPIAPAPAPTPVKETVKETITEDPKKKAPKVGRSTRNGGSEPAAVEAVAATPTPEVKVSKKRDRSKRKSEGVVA